MMKTAEMNPQEKAFWNGLPTGFQSFTRVSNSHRERLSIVQNRLMDFYGERADWKRCLEKYRKSSDYQKSCRCVTDPAKIPELSEADVIEMIRQAEKDEQLITELLSLQEIITNADRKQPTTPEMYRAAEILGILPNSEDGLNSWFTDFSDLSETEKIEIEEKIKNQSAAFSIILTALTDFYLDGFVEAYPQCGTVLTQSKRRYYYRGENAFYASSKPGLARTVQHRLPDHINGVLQWLRINEGCLFLDHFDAVMRWPLEKSVNYIALAQHYGLKTMMMDVTSDLKTALFFACCRYENGAWRPLKQDEIAEKNARKEIARLGGDSRYAILYRSPTDITEMLWATQDDPGLNIITPIGYQPFMRCTAQYGYMLLTQNNGYDMMKDHRFEKMKIRLSEDFCRKIFEEMECGEKIYPHKDIPDLSEYFGMINQATVFSEKAFLLTAESLKIAAKDYDTLKKELSRYGIGIIQNGARTYLSEKKLRKINKYYSAEKSVEINHVSPISRPMFVMENVKK